MNQLYVALSDGLRKREHLEESGQGRRCFGDERKHGGGMTSLGRGLLQFAEKEGGHEGVIALALEAFNETSF